MKLRVPTVFVTICLLAMISSVRAQDSTPVQNQNRSASQRGVFVSEVGNLSFADDLLLHDVIVEINREAVNSVDDYRNTVAKLKPGQDVVFKILRHSDDGSIQTMFLAETVPADFNAKEQLAALDRRQRTGVQNAADQGDAVAQNNLGNMYYHGQGVSQDSVQAAAWYRKAADQGFVNAQDNLGFLYLNGQGVVKDDAQAARWFRKAADQGFASAQTHLADRYWLGEGVVKDYEQAAIWNRKAADQGFARAQNDLGYLYANGQGVAQDYTQATIWYQKAAEQGYQPAKDGLQNIQVAISYRKAADQGDAVGQNNLGYLYEHGKGVPQDYAQAAIWYRKAAEQGYATAQDNLGDLYRYDHPGVDRDWTQAAIWYRKAADQGLVLAQTHLAHMYLNGLGVPKDYAQAALWYRKAADQGDVHAQNNLGDLYLNGQGVAEDVAQAKAWYRKAADHGDEYAKDQLESLQAARVAQDNPQAQAEAENTGERQQRIARLQGDIEELEQEASRWDASAEEVSSNNCTGAAAALCNGISTFGAAKARQDAAKARREAQSDREEIQRLLNVPVQHVHIDTSYGAGLHKQTDAHPIGTIQDTADQQAAAIRAIGDANAAAQRQAAQQRLAAQQAAQQTAAQTSSSTQPRTYRAMTQCVKVVSATYSSGDIREVITNTCGETIRATVTHYRTHDTCVDGETMNIAPGASFTFGNSTDRNWYQAVADNNTDWAVTGQGPALQIPNSCLDRYPVK